MRFSDGLPDLYVELKAPDIFVRRRRIGINAGEAKKILRKVTTTVKPKLNARDKLIPLVQRLTNISNISINQCRLCRIVDTGKAGALEAKEKAQTSRRF